MSIRVYSVVTPWLAVALREGGSLFLYGNGETKFRENFYTEFLYGDRTNTGYADDRDTQVGAIDPNRLGRFG